MPRNFLMKRKFTLLDDLKRLKELKHDEKPKREEMNAVEWSSPIIKDTHRSSFLVDRLLSRKTNELYRKRSIDWSEQRLYAPYKEENVISKFQNVEHLTEGPHRSVASKPYKDRTEGLQDVRGEGRSAFTKVIRSLKQEQPEEVYTTTHSPSYSSDGSSSSVHAPYTPRKTTLKNSKAKVIYVPYTRKFSHYASHHKGVCTGPCCEPTAEKTSCSCPQCHINRDFLHKDRSKSPGQPVHQTKQRDINNNSAYIEGKDVKKITHDINNVRAQNILRTKEGRGHQRSRAVANLLERKRVAELNTAFEQLRALVPAYANEDRSLSKIKTLKYALTYITHLMNILDDKDELNLKDFSRDQAAAVKTVKHMLKRKVIA